MAKEVNKMSDHRESQVHTFNPEPTIAPAAPPEAATPMAAPAPVAVPAADERYRKLTLDDAGSTFAYGNTSHSGFTVNRVDFIRAAWTTARQPRGAIAKEVSRLVGKKVTYQIIFAATKGVAGGPPASGLTPTTPTTPTTPPVPAA